MPKNALITGQDGSYLAEFLLEKGYEVHGIKRLIAQVQPDEFYNLGAQSHVADDLNSARRFALLKAHGHAIPIAREDGR